MCGEFLEYLNCLKCVGFFSLKSITICLVFRTSYSGFEILFSKEHVNGRNRNTENRVAVILALKLVACISQATALLMNQHGDGV